MDPPDSQGVLPCSMVLRNSLRENWISNTRLSLSMVIYSKIFSYPHFSYIESPATPRQRRGLGSTAFARRYWRYLIWFLFLTLLRCFSSGSAPPIAIRSAFANRLYDRLSRLNRDGLLHSETAGSQAVYRFPDDIVDIHTSFLGQSCQGIHYRLYE